MPEVRIPEVNYKQQELNAIKLRKSKLINNNILGSDDDDDEHLKRKKSQDSNDDDGGQITFISQVRISQIYNILMIYGKQLVQLWFLVCSLVVTNIYGFVFKREKNVSDENVLITGSGGYLGRYLAIQFAKRNANLILWDTDETTNQKTLEILNLLGYNRAHIFTVDVSNERLVRATAQLVKQKFGFVSLVVNGASLRITPKSVLDISYNKDIEEHFLTEYMSHIWLIQEFLQSMINRNNGHFVTISSQTSIVDMPLISVYSSLKSAQAKLSQSVREELRVNNINNVHMSVVYTGMLDGGQATDFDSHFEINDCIRSTNIQNISEIIVSGVLMNKTHIFVPAYSRILFVLKYLISPKIIAFVAENFVKVKENGMKLRAKIY